MARVVGTCCVSDYQAPTLACHLLRNYTPDSSEDAHSCELAPKRRPSRLLRRLSFKEEAEEWFVNDFPRFSRSSGSSASTPRALPSTILRQNSPKGPEKVSSSQGLPRTAAGKEQAGAFYLDSFDTTPGERHFPPEREPCTASAGKDGTDEKNYIGGDTTEFIVQEQPTGLRIAIALDKAIVPLLSMFNRGSSGP